MALLQNTAHVTDGPCGLLTLRTVITALFQKVLNESHLAFFQPSRIPSLDNRLGK